MARSSPIPTDAVEIDVDGEAYAGSFYVQDKVITVRGSLGRLATHQVGPAADSIARMLLREIVHGYLARA